MISTKSQEQGLTPLSRFARASFLVKTPSTFLAALVAALLCRHALAATFTIADGDVAGLKAAINTANGNNDDDTINLAAGGAYTLTAVDNSTKGPNGLPVIGADNAGGAAHKLTINGNGATIQRSGAGSTPQ